MPLFYHTPVSLSPLHPFSPSARSAVVIGAGLGGLSAAIHCIPTHTDPSLAPPGHDVLYVLVPCPNTLSRIDWEREGPLLRERTLQKLEATVLPGLCSRIVYERAFTPADFESRYGCYAGAAFGGLTPALLQSTYFRLHHRSEEIQSLYFVGASTHPGGGVPIVLISGRLTVEEIVSTFRAF